MDKDTQPIKRVINSYLLLVFKGMGMGAADIIPGVSGGTIAFISGIYQELINSIKSFDIKLVRLLSTGNLHTAWKHVNGNFLVAVFGGILLSIFSLAKLISWLLMNYQMLVWAFFFGLIIGSAIFVGRKINAWRPLTIVMFFLGTIIAWYITVASPATTSEELWFVFIAGTIAISAMILPGISGSFILLLMGKYEFILNAVKDINVTVLGVFALGCITGIISFSKVISWLFRKLPNATMALLTGFMTGSLNKLWPWKEVLEYRIDSHGEKFAFLERSISPQYYSDLYDKDPMIIPVIICAISGLALVFLIEVLATPEKFTLDKHQQMDS